MTLNSCNNHQKEVVYQEDQGIMPEANFDTVFVKRRVSKTEYEIDTLLIKSGISSPQVLAGTMFLPYSDKMIGLLNNGLSPLSFGILKECDETIDPKTFKDYPKYNNIKRDSSALTIDVTVVANCCHNFLGEAEVIGKDTLNLVYTAYGGFCSCSCCFTLRYKFETSMEANYQILKHITINSSTVIGEIPEIKKNVVQH